MKLGKIKNIQIKLHLSTLIIVALVGYYAATLYFDLVGGKAALWEYILVGALNGVLMLFSIFIHELMHSIFAQRYGLKVTEIELYVFGGVSKIQEEPKTPKTEFIIAIVGPLTSLFLGVGLFTLYLQPFFLFSPILIVTFYYSGYTNLILGAFNMLPAFPMDGGRVLRSILWKKRKDLLSATKTASKVGVAFGYALIAIGFLETIFLEDFSGLWTVLMGFFLASSARKGLIQTIYDLRLSNFTARQIMRQPRVAIPINIFVNDAVKDAFTTYRYPYFP